MCVVVSESVCLTTLEGVLIYTDASYDHQARTSINERLNKKSFPTIYEWGGEREGIMGKRV